MRTVAIVLATSLFTTMSTIAAAQSVQPLIPFTTDTLSQPDARDAAALNPLRLGLMTGAVPHSFGTPGCDPAGRATGMSPMPNRPIAANGIRLFRDARLTLFGFSSDGCAFDQHVGGGLAFTVPITTNVMFMWGGGALYLPNGGGLKGDRTDIEARVGVVWKTKSGRSYNVGISAQRGSPRVSFGGMF